MLSNWRNHFRLNPLPVQILQWLIDGYTQTEKFRNKSDKLLKSDFFGSQLQESINFPFNIGNYRIFSSKMTVQVFHTFSTFLITTVLLQKLPVPNAHCRCTYPGRTHHKSNRKTLGSNQIPTADFLRSYLAQAHNTRNILRHTQMLRPAVFAVHSQM